MISQWRRKYLGEGAQVYQTLREIRAWRYRLDADAESACAYTVALEVGSMRIFVYFPPGNTRLADAFQAPLCEPPVFSRQSLAPLYKEQFPLRPVVGLSGLDKPLSLQPDEWQEWLDSSENTFPPD